MTELSLIVRATAILLVCFGVLGLCRHGAAALRALILTLAFAALLLLPIAAAVLPALRVASPIPTATVRVPRVSAAVAPLPVAASIIARATAPLHRTAAIQSPASVLGVIWAAGVVLFTVPLFVTVWRVSRVRRRATTWDRGESIARALVGAQRTTRVPRVLSLIHI